MKKFIITYMDGEQKTIEADLVETTMGGLHYEFMMIHPSTPECDMLGFKSIFTVPAMNVRNIEHG